MERNKVVYIHRRASDNSVFYVGMGSLKRAYSLQRSDMWNRVVKKHGLIVEIVSENLTKDEAWSLEIDLIKRYGRLDMKTGCLVNHTKGGNSIDDIPKSAEKKRVNKIKNFKRSKEWGDKISKAMKGKPKTEEWKKRISDMNKGKRKSEEVKQKMRESSRAEELKGKPIACHDYNTGELLFEALSISGAARMLWCSPTSIFHNLVGRSSSITKNILNRKLKFNYIETNREVHSSKNS